MSTSLKLAPSILSADFTCLRKQIEASEKGGADWLHLDVMDGVFVPNLTFGPFIVKHIRQCTKLYLDCHLMVRHPEKYFEAFAGAGVQGITVHQEACLHLDAALTRIRSLGCRAGVTLNPSTPVETLDLVLPLADLVLIMSVNPGFGGQKMIPYCLDKVRQVRQKAAALGLDLDVEIDGGIKPANVAQAVAAGANVIVAGSAVFNGDPKAACHDLKKLMLSAGSV